MVVFPTMRLYLGLSQQKDDDVAPVYNQEKEKKVDSDVKEEHNDQRIVPFYGGTLWGIGPSFSRRTFFFLRLHVCVSVTGWFWFNPTIFES